MNRSLVSDPVLYRMMNPLVATDLFAVRSIVINTWLKTSFGAAVGSVGQWPDTSAFGSDGWISKIRTGSPVVQTGGNLYESTEPLGTVCPAAAGFPSHWRSDPPRAQPAVAIATTPITAIATTRTNPRIETTVNLDPFQQTDSNQVRLRFVAVEPPLTTRGGLCNARYYGTWVARCQPDKAVYPISCALLRDPASSSRRTIQIASWSSSNAVASQNTGCRGRSNGK